MKIILKYTGALNSTTDVKDKQRVRDCFHRQLKRVWEAQGDNILKGVRETPWSSNETVDKMFVPLVRKEHDLRVKLDIDILKDPARKSNKQFDLDNKLKTLFDCLRIPNTPQEMQRIQEELVEVPYFGLLQDDHLVEAVSIRKGDWMFAPDEQEGKHHNEMHFFIFIKAHIYAASRNELNENFPLGAAI
ncbi:MAG: hypothetical protein S4CHLAM102_15670 [Chlamydiia bacterium]|nr:hypothetical protein [Chlamydiia bacterium]